jgi:hypothetical protein
MLRTATLEDETGFYAAFDCEVCGAGYISKPIVLSEFSPANFQRFSCRDLNNAVTVDIWGRERPNYTWQFLNIPAMNQTGINLCFNNMYGLCDHQWYEEKEPGSYFARCQKCDYVFSGELSMKKIATKKRWNRQFDFFSKTNEKGKTKLLLTVDHYNPDLRRVDNFPLETLPNHTFCLDFYKFLVFHLAIKISEVGALWEKTLPNEFAHKEHSNAIDLKHFRKMYPFFHRFMGGHSLYSLSQGTSTWKNTIMSNVDLMEFLNNEKR